jgi:hypothetical protein
MGVVVARLSSASQRNSRAALSVVATALEDGELVEAAIAGRALGHNAAAVLTRTRLVVATDRSWSPDVVSLDLAGGAEVQGWEDGRNAVLEVKTDAVTLVMDQIRDGELAREMAALLRAKP